MLSCGALFDLPLGVEFSFYHLFVNAFVFLLNLILRKDVSGISPSFASVVVEIGVAVRFRLFQKKEPIGTKVAEEKGKNLSTGPSPPEGGGVQPGGVERVVGD